MFRGLWSLESPVFVWVSSIGWPGPHGGAYSSLCSRLCATTSRLTLSHTCNGVSACNALSPSQLWLHRSLPSSPLEFDERFPTRIGGRVRLRSPLSPYPSFLSIF